MGISREFRKQNSAEFDILVSLSFKSAYSLVVVALYNLCITFVYMAVIESRHL